MSISLNKPNMILKSLKLTIHSFYELYDSSATTEEEQKQNILRSIILFSCSGVDAIVKQLINDALEEVIAINEGAFNEFKNFTESKILSKDRVNSKLLSELFTSNNPQKVLMKLLKKELTQNSLQSADELFKVASFFNIETNKLEPSPKELKEIFKVRNQITHELDVDMESDEFVMRKREIELVKKYSNHLLNLSEKFILLVENTLKNKESIETNS